MPIGLMSLIVLITASIDYIQCFPSCQWRYTATRSRIKTRKLSAQCDAQWFIDACHLSIIIKLAAWSTLPKIISLKKSFFRHWAAFWILLPGSGHIDTAIWMHYMDANKTAGEETRWQLHKNAACNPQQVLAATPHKTPTVRPPAPYHEIYSS